MMDQTISGTLSVTGALSVGDSTELGSDVHARSNLQISGSSYIYGSLTIGGPVDVQDVIGTQGDLKVGGTSSLLGNVGVGIAQPQSQLHIKGGKWNLGTTEGDFKIGNDQYRLKMGVALGGNGAGDTYIRAQGGTNRLMLGSDSSNVMFIQGNNASVGLKNPRTQFHVLGRIASGLDFQSAGSITFYPPDGFAWFHIDNGPAGGRPIGRLRISHGENPGDREIMTIVQNHRIGIGTPNPQTTLHIVGDRIRMRKAGVANQYIDIRADGSALDVESSKDLYLNNNGQRVFYRNMSQVSSRSEKENITSLSTTEALDILQGLAAVKFNYKNDVTGEAQLGFIAEEVADTVTTADHKGIKPMSLIAVLSSVVKEQQRLIDSLQQQINGPFEKQPGQETCAQTSLPLAGIIL